MFIISEDGRCYGDPVPLNPFNVPSTDTTLVTSFQYWAF